MKLDMDIIDPPRMFLKYRKMITYAIHQKISFFHYKLQVFALSVIQGFNPSGG